MIPSLESLQNTLKKSICRKIKRNKEIIQIEGYRSSCNKEWKGIGKLSSNDLLRRSGRIRRRILANLLSLLPFQRTETDFLLPRFPHFPLVDSINLSSKFNEHIAEWSPPGARFEFSYNCRPITGQEPREIVPPSFNFWYSPAIHPQLIRL